MGQLGETFRERRIALGVTLEQAEQDTKIRAKLLDALEEGDYARLPNPGYVRGYVSSYARYLELDPVPLLAMYRAETGAGRFHDINLAPDEAVAPRDEQHAVPWRAALIGVAIIAVVSAAVWFGWSATHKSDKLPPIPTTPSQTTSGTVPSSGPGAPAQATTSPFTIKVSVSQSGASSLVVTVDGKQAYNGTLTGGESKQFDVTGSAVLKIGKPSAVTVLNNGVPVKLPTKPSSTVTLTAPTTP